MRSAPPIETLGATGKGSKMLGLADWGVSLAFLLTLGSTALCALYGCLHWNEPAPEVEVAEIAEEEAWEQSRVGGSLQ